MEKMRFESVDGFQGKISAGLRIFSRHAIKEQKDNDGRTSEKSISIRCSFFWESIKRKAKHANFHGSESGKP